MSRTPEGEPAVYLAVTDASLMPQLTGIPAWSADEYLEGDGPTLLQGATVINLCRSYQYLSKGYYVSLLADARGQRVLPSLEMIEQISNPFAYFRALREAGLDTIDFKLVGGRRLLPRVIVPVNGKPEILDAHLQEEGERPAVALRYRRGPASYCEVTAVFGKTLDPRFRRQVAAIFHRYAFPLLRVRMYREGRAWKVGQIFPIPMNQLNESEQRFFQAQISKPLALGKRVRSHHARLHRIACLWDKDDPFAASDEETLERFTRVALQEGVLFEIIGKDDLARLGEYDALFIRTVTGIDHYSFAFAQRAQSMGMPVIDDPQSIMKCSNKVYLHELFQREGIPTPRTITVSRRTPAEETAALGFPLIVKLPQGSFSTAVKKADDSATLQSVLNEMLKGSPLLIVQEFTPTSFDWRITVLEGKILFCCRYHQAKDHWQIAQHYASGYTRYGKVEAVRERDVPLGVRKLALRGASLIGDGLYGVDLKETRNGPLMIEINDNPNIDANFEDAIAKNRLYQCIIQVFQRRLRAAARAARKVNQ